jgi:hypothetical protein
LKRVTSAPTAAISPDADHQWQLALGERHAAIAPDVDVIECDRPDAYLHLAGGRRGWLWRIHDDQLAIGNESERTHEVVSPGEGDV